MYPANHALSKVWSDVTFHIRELVQYNLDADISAQFRSIKRNTAERTLVTGISNHYHWWNGITDGIFLSIHHSFCFTKSHCLYVHGIGIEECQTKGRDFLLLNMKQVTVNGWTMILYTKLIPEKGQYAIIYNWNASICKNDQEDF